MFPRLPQILVLPRHIRKGCKPVLPSGMLLHEGMDMLVYLVYHPR